MSDESIIRSLRERLDALEDENITLRKHLSPKWVAPAVLGLSRTKGEVLAALMATPGTMTREALGIRLFGLYETRHHRCIDVHICQLRKKLAPWGIWVMSVHGVGYQLSPEAKAKIVRLHDKERGLAA
jgi:DNA-binding response OmpR family regulator